ncbi:AAA family ATPase [Embleya sp. NPDC059259]|uniref:AAA family ATPase n=1 Tax=unclassified Embleya TaxID=2699296 RepID=UPI0036C441E9
MSAATDADTRHLRARLWLLEARTRDLLTAARPNAEHTDTSSGAAETAPTDPLPDSDGRAALEDWADGVERDGGRLRLRHLERVFGLRPHELDALVAVAAPHLDTRHAALYRALWGAGPDGDATPALTMRLAGLPDATAHTTWAAAAPLRARALVEFVADDEGAPFLTRALRPARRVAAFMAGDDHLDDALIGIARTVDTPPASPEATDRGTALTGVAAAVRAAVASTYVRHPAGDCAAEAVIAAVLGCDRAVLHVDLRGIGAWDNPAAVLAAVRREARLGDRVIVAGPLEAFYASPGAGADGGRLARLLRTFLAPDPACPPPPLVLTGSRAWEDDGGDGAPVRIDVPSPTVEERHRLWERWLAPTALAGHAHAWAHCRLPAPLARRAVEAATRHALLEDREPSRADVDDAIRAHSPPELERLTRRIRPTATLDDLILPPAPRADLDDLLARARHRDLVLRRWRLSPGSARGHGVVALFRGSSGTGKTLAAEALAHALGGDLHVVDLAAVVDKYIGETEKNLDRVLTHAAHLHGVLLFDEADALFGKRSAVKDAHDRHANTQTAHLLQRLEAFDGVAILTTNLADNIDDAFTRRLDHITHFPSPDAGARRALWEICLGPRLPRHDDLDLDRLAAAFPLTGGSIRSCALTAAYRAATTDTPVTTADLVDAIEAEHRKLGLLLDPDKFDAHRAARGRNT